MQTIGEEAERIIPQISHSSHSLGMVRVVRRQAVKHFIHRLESGGLGPIAGANDTPARPPFYISTAYTQAQDSGYESSSRVIVVRKLSLYR